MTATMKDTGCSSYEFLSRVPVPGVDMSLPGNTCDVVGGGRIPIMNIARFVVMAVPKTDGIEML